MTRSWIAKIQGANYEVRLLCVFIIVTINPLLWRIFIMVRPTSSTIHSSRHFIATTLLFLIGLSLTLLRSRTQVAKMRHASHIRPLVMRMIQYHWLGTITSRNFKYFRHSSAVNVNILRCARVKHGLSLLSKKTD